MERVSGWYKRKVQIVTLAVAIVFAVGLNLDSVLIARHLARDAALRSAIVAEAEQLAKEPAPAQGRQQLEDRIQELKSIGVPIGWPDPDGAPATADWILVKVLGLLLTAGAASLGAPFWFDVLNRVISIRAAGKAPEETPKAPKQIPLPAAPGQAEPAIRRRQRCPRRSEARVRFSVVICVLPLPPPPPPPPPPPSPPPPPPPPPPPTPPPPPPPITPQPTSPLRTRTAPTR